MRYALTFLLLAVGCFGASLAIWNSVGWIAILLWYPAVSFALIAVAYARASPRMLFKKDNGERSAVGWLLFAPYFLLNELTFGLYRLLSREPAFTQVSPNLFFGRRLSDREHQACAWVNVLDLACEFSEARSVRKSPGYRSLPVLDADSPSEPELRSSIEWIGEAVLTGSTYVHCALGHGRSPCLVIGYLLTVGTVDTVAEGEQLLRSLRPGVRLHQPQLRLLRRFERTFSP